MGEGIKAEDFSSIPSGQTNLFRGRARFLVLTDRLHERYDLVRVLVQGLGFSVCEPTASIGPPETKIPIALVGIDGPLKPGSPAFDNVARCKSLGLEVIVYAHGVQEWPVRSKCVPLLAGATHLLDSSRASFRDELAKVLQRIFQSLDKKAREKEEVMQLMQRHGIVGISSGITAVFRLAMRFSELSDLPVLITGESGTGKELLAKAIARMDPRRKDGPIVSVNCAAVSPALLESEFFGHRRGAFTGAERDRSGLIRAAEGGVLFLDEIGELDLGLQAKLLRVLQDNSLTAVGEEKEVPVNVRFIAATNQSLGDRIALGRFRADLFYRLRVLHAHIPALRERPVDMPLLIEHFLQKHGGLQIEQAVEINQDFVIALQQTCLPGNVRQLENLIRESLATRHADDALDLSDIPSEILRQLSEPIDATPTNRTFANSMAQPIGAEISQGGMNDMMKQILEREGWNLSTTLCECERHAFQAALDRAHGNQTAAARLLGITARSVYNKVRKYGLCA
jgi:transcriptional regulator with PAS, ATPase and Fis domain